MNATRLLAPREWRYSLVFRRFLASAISGVLTIIVMDLGITAWFLREKYIRGTLTWDEVLSPNSYFVISRVISFGGALWILPAFVVGKATAVVVLGEILDRLFPSRTEPKGPGPGAD